MFTSDEIARIKAHFTYNPKTGEIQRSRRYGARPVGTQSRDGYLYIKVLDRRIGAHRLAYLLETGSLPSKDIDHINGNRIDNRFSNLRDVSRGTNQENKRPTSQQNATGFMGVSFHYGKWRAKIQVKGKTVIVGSFNTPQAAHDAYLQAKRQLHAGCTI